MPLKSDSMIAEVEIGHLWLPVAHLYMCATADTCTCVPLAGYALFMKTLEVLKHLDHAKLVDNRSVGVKQF